MPNKSLENSFFLFSYPFQFCLFMLSRKKKISLDSCHNVKLFAMKNKTKRKCLFISHEAARAFSIPLSSIFLVISFQFLSQLFLFFLVQWNDDGGKHSCFTFMLKYLTFIKIKNDWRIKWDEWQKKKEARISPFPFIYLTKKKMKIIFL